MTELQYSVHVTPSKPTLSDDFPPGEDRRVWQGPGVVPFWCEMPGLG